VILKIIYPHGSIDFDYDEKLNRFLPLHSTKQNDWHHHYSKVHPSRYQGHDKDAINGEIEMKKTLNQNSHEDVVRYENNCDSPVDEDELERGLNEDDRLRYREKG
jgi:hypothetical protein